MGKFDLSLNIEYESQASDVERVEIHPDWDSERRSYDADIAVLVLKNLVILSDFIQPICLPEFSNQDLSGRGIISGWGRSEKRTSNFDSSNLLNFLLEFTPFNFKQSQPKKLTIPIINSTFCYKTFPILKELSSNQMFCGGYINEGKVPCMGDLGGGFYMLNDSSWFIRGIISTPIVHDNDCNTNMFSLYTNVAVYVKWIKNVMEQK